MNYRTKMLLAVLAMLLVMLFAAFSVTKMAKDSEQSILRRPASIQTEFAGAFRR